MLIWGVAVGLALLVGWRLLEATVGHRGAEGSELWRKRAVSLLKAVLYGALAVSAVKVATGSGGGGSTDTMTARLMGLPGGLLLVGAVGLAVIGYGAVQIWRGWTEKFLEHLDATGRSGQSGTAYTLLGKVGHVAKGIALIVVGGLFCYAALTQDPKKSGGLDAALQEVLQQPFGPYLLGGIALGIGCYGLFCFARARHLDR